MSDDAPPDSCAPPEPWAVDERAVAEALAVDEQTINAVGDAVMARLFGATAGAPPRREGDYELGRRIDEAGIGKTYLAQHVSSGQSALVSSTEPDERDPLRVDALIGFRHRRVLPVLAQWSDKGRHWIATEVPPALDIRRWAMESTGDWQGVVRVFSEVAEGLAAAHARGLVHGRLRPRVLRVDDAGHGLVMDFACGGLAVGEQLADGPLRDYSAPERIRGQPCTPASDQFGFCVALYECLCGMRPFRGPTVVALLTRISSGVREPIPDGIEVPRRVLRVLDRGLRPDPKRRYPSMNALLAALRRTLLPWWRRGLPSWPR